MSLQMLYQMLSFRNDLFIINRNTELQRDILTRLGFTSTTRGNVTATYGAAEIDTSSWSSF